MVVELHERTLARLLGPTQPPKPRKFRSLEPGERFLRDTIRLQTWTSAGTLTGDVSGLAKVYWWRVFSDSFQGDFKSPTYHEYNVGVYRHHRGTAYSRDSTTGNLVRSVEGPVYDHSLGSFIGPSGYVYAPYLPDPTSNSFYNQALDKLNEKTRSSVDLSIDLLQSRQGIDMAKSLSSLVGTVVRFAAGAANPFRVAASLLKRDPRKLRLHMTYVNLLKRGSKEAADRWLMWQYGIAPMVSTFHGIVENMLHVADGSTRRVVAQYRVPLTPVEDWTMQYDGHTLQGPLWVSGVVGAKFTIDLKDQDPGLGDFTSLNPASIAWEMLPFSFVADWVYDVGSYLRNAETRYLMMDRFKGGYLTQFRFAEISHNITKVTTSGLGGSVVEYSGTSSERYRRRSVLYTYPDARAPSFDVKLGSSRLLSAAALLRGVLK